MVNLESETCSKCNIDVCTKCGKKIPFSTVHRCKLDDINTLKVLRTGIKNCPSCRTIIYKIEGCDQMFCTICYTAFSWDTLKIITGVVHNPHYFELLEKGVIKERAAEYVYNKDDYDEIMNRENEVDSEPEIYEEFINLVHAVFTILDKSVLERIEKMLKELNTSFKHTRDEYILNIIDEDSFKKRVYTISRNIYILKIKQEYANLVDGICRSCAYKIIDNDYKIEDVIKKLRDAEHEVYTLEELFDRDCDIVDHNELENDWSNIFLVFRDKRDRWPS